MQSNSSQAECTRPHLLILIMDSHMLPFQESKRMQADLDFLLTVAIIHLHIKMAVYTRNVPVLRSQTSNCTALEKHWKKNLAISTFWMNLQAGTLKMPMEKKKA